MTAARDAKARPDFQKLLLESELFLAMPDLPEREESRLAETDKSISILNVTADDGRIIPAVFTSPQRISETFDKVVGYVGLPGRTALEMLQANGAVLNPASAYGVAWSPEDLALILGQPVARTVERDSRVLSVPHERPERLIAILQGFIADELRIEEAWLALARWRETEEQAWYLEIRSTNSAEDLLPLFKEIREKAKGEKLPLDVEFAKPSDEPGKGIRLKPIQTE